MSNQLTYKPFGDKALLIEWPATINEEILADILQFKERILADKSARIVECVSGYNSLTIVYTEEILDFKSEVTSLASLYEKRFLLYQTRPTLWKVPVCYDSAFGIDLEEMSHTLKLSVQEIIDLHSQAVYTVYFIGFLPGFLYLGGLDKRLEIKRKSDPRLQVDKGSVAIGGAQTGVYPEDSAGGWNIIGKTPISFFNLNDNHPCFAKPGDKIQFVPIAIEEYQNITQQELLVQPEKMAWNG